MSIENAKELLESLRCEIDAADKDLLDAFIRRMEVSSKIAECKKEGGIGVADPGRERRKWLTSPLPLPRK